MSLMILSSMNPQLMSYNKSFKKNNVSKRKLKATSISGRHTVEIPESNQTFKKLCVCCRECPADEAEGSGRTVPPRKSKTRYTPVVGLIKSEFFKAEGMITGHSPSLCKF